MSKSLRFAGLALSILLVGSGCSDDENGSKDSSAKLLSIESFAVDKRRVEMGEEVKVSWSVKNAEAFELWANDVFVDTDGSPQGEILVPVDETTAFRLFARKGEDRADRTIVVGVKNFDPSPVILAFTSTPREVEEGQAVTLSWITFNASSVEIRGPEGTPLDLGGASAEQGEVTVHPTTDSTYRIFANGEGTTEQTVFVKVRGKPAAGFSASSAKVTPGEAVTLSWEVEDATHVVVRVVGGKILVDTKTNFSGSIQVFPEQSTTYELRAVGAWKDVTQTVHVDVPPEIVSFAVVEKGPVGVGRLATLSWTTRGATELEVGNSQGEFEVITGFRVAEGLARIPASPDGVFELKARSAGEEQVQRITVETLEPPRVGDFRVTPDYMSARAQPVKVTVSWEGIENADEVTLVGSVIGRVGIFQPPFEDGALELWLRQTNELTLTARNAAGDTVRKTTAVLVPLPVIEDFNLFPRHAGVGETIQVSWNVTGSDTIALEFNGQPVTVDPKMGAGSIPFTITEPGNLRLVATNEAGGSVERVRSATMGPPEIRAFSIPRTVVHLGNALAFTWTNLGGTQVTLLRDGAVECQINQPEQIEQGGCIVSGNQLGTFNFTLRLENGLGEFAEKNLRVQVTNGPIIISFTSDPSERCIDEGVSLAWEVNNDLSGTAPTLYLEDSSGMVYDVTNLDPNEDSLLISQLATGTTYFTLRAVTPAGEDERGIPVETIDTRFISVSANPSTVSSGQPVTISWQTRCADKVSLNVGAFEGAPVTAPFVDVSSTGSFVTNSSTDDGFGTINFPAGFVFPFAGQNQTAIRANTNGWLGFDFSSPSCSWCNDNFSTSPWANMAVFWDDLHMTSPFNGWYSRLHSENGKQGLVVQFKSAHFCCSRSWDLNFQAILWEDGTFDYRYGTMGPTGDGRVNGNSAAIGYQAPGESHLISQNTAVAGGMENRAYRFDYKWRSPNGSITINPTASRSVLLKASGSSTAQTSVQINVQ